MSRLLPGLYDTLIDQLSRAEIADLHLDRLKADLLSVESAELPDRVGEVVSSWISDSLRSVPTAERANVSRDLSRAIQEAILTVIPDGADRDRQLDHPIHRLVAVSPLDPAGEPLRAFTPRSTRTTARASAS